MKHPLLASACAVFALFSAPAMAGQPVSSPTATNSGNSAQLQQVAAFEHQVTGVTLSQEGRVFVNFPRWTEDAPVSVAEVARDGALKPFPDQEWNAWRNAKRDEVSAEDHFVCVQSVVMDRQNNLWALDPAAPAQDKIVPGGPKLVKINLASNTVAQNIAFDESIAPQGSYLNDVRFSPDGRYAYITDSGARGALVVVSLSDGKARRVLDGHPSTQPEKDVHVKVDGEVLRRPDGREVQFAADGIALSADGSRLYWQAVKGKTLYRIDTQVLQNAALSAEEVGAAVERVGENGPADGLLIDERDRLYVSAVEEHAVKIREGGQLSTLVKDEKLRWPDTFARGPDGTVYVTDSRIPDMMWFKPESGPRLPTVLYRIEGRR